MEDVEGGGGGGGTPVKSGLTLEGSNRHLFYKGREEEVEEEEKGDNFRLGGWLTKVRKSQRGESGDIPGV